MKKKISLTTNPKKIKIYPISDKQKAALLRQGKAYELQPFGIWYYKNDKGVFERVHSTQLKMDDVWYKEFIKDCSRKGLIYLSRDHPNRSVEPEWEIFDHISFRHEKQRDYKKS